MGRIWNRGLYFDEFGDGYFRITCEIWWHGNRAHRVQRKPVSVEATQCEPATAVVLNLRAASAAPATTHSRKVTTLGSFAVARWPGTSFEHAPIRFALIGFSEGELCRSKDLLSNGIPQARWCGYLVPDTSSLEWYPPNLCAPIRPEKYPF